MKTREQIELKFKNLCNIFDAYEERFSRLLDAKDEDGLNQLITDYYDLQIKFSTLCKDCEEAGLPFDIVDIDGMIDYKCEGSIAACYEVIDCIIEAKHEEFFSEMC